MKNDPYGNEFVFDSAYYLKHSAMGEDELPGYDPNAPVDPDHIMDDENDVLECTDPPRKDR